MSIALLLYGVRTFVQLMRLLDRILRGCTHISHINRLMEVSILSMFFLRPWRACHVIELLLSALHDNVSATHCVDLVSMVLKQGCI